MDEPQSAAIAATSISSPPISPTPTPQQSHPISLTTPNTSFTLNDSPISNTPATPSLSYGSTPPNPPDTPNTSHASSTGHHHHHTPLLNASSPAYLNTSPSYLNSSPLLFPRTASSLSASTPLLASPQILSSSQITNPLTTSSPSSTLSLSGPVLFSTNSFTLPDLWGCLKSQNTRLISSYDLLKSFIVVGRGKEADAKIPSHLRSISNKHCVISIGREVDADSNSSPWFTYITDLSVNGTYVNGKPLPKGQRVLLLDNSIVSLVYPKPEDHTACVSFTFQTFLSSLSQATLALLESEYSNENHTVIAKRLHQLQSSTTQSLKNTKKPEYFIYVLKVEATCPNLLLLHDILRWSIHSNEKWIETFISLGGVSAVLDVVAVNNRKSRTFEADVAVDIECLKIIEDFISYPPGLDALAKHVESLDDVVLMLLNPNHAVRVKTNAISIMLNVCSHSESGYRVIVNAMERLQKVKRERSRFLFLVHTLITEQDHEYKVKCMSLINCIINSPHDLTLRAKHKHEFVNLGLMRIVEVLYQEHNSALDAQLEIFSKHMDEDDMFYRTVNLEYLLCVKVLKVVTQIRDPLSVCKAIVDQIRRYKDSSTAFVGALRRILALCSSSPAEAPDANFYNNLSKSFELISKLASTLAEIAVSSPDTNINVHSQRIEQLSTNMDSLPRAQLMEPHSPTPVRATPEPVQPVDKPNLPPSPPPGPPPPPPPPGGPPPPAPPGGPPPPPPGGKPALPLKKLEDLPKVPMRQLFWTKMAPTKIKNTVWDPNSSSPASIPNSPAMLHRFAAVISPPPSAPYPASPPPAPTSPITYEQVKLDKEELETIFCSKKQKAGAATNGSAVAKHEEVKEAKEVSLLDMRRSNNIGIVLSRLKVSPDSIKDDLMQMDEKLLTKEKVVALLKCVPTADEEALLKSYSGDAPLASVEQFLLQMMKIPRIGARLECIQYKVGFESSITEVKEAVDCVANACKALMNDEAFKQLLLVVLKFGNFMNGGSARGGAVGFKINCLLNLSETKSADNKTTLLHYLVMYMRQHNPEILDKCELMFRCAEPVSRVVWKEVLLQFELLKNGMSKLEAELTNFPESSGEIDQFRPLIYYGEEGVSPEDFFSILHDFNTVFMKAQRDNERERVAAAKREAIAAQKKKVEASTTDSKTTKMDITHNMFKIIDSKRPRKLSSPLASPTTTPPSLSFPNSPTFPSTPTNFMKSNSQLKINSSVNSNHNSSLTPTENILPNHQTPTDSADITSPRTTNTATTNGGTNSGKSKVASLSTTFGSQHFTKPRTTPPTSPTSNFSKQKSNNGTPPTSPIATSSYPMTPTDASPRPPFLASPPTSPKGFQNGTATLP